MRKGRTKPQSVSPDYVVGLTDGEGCFYVNVHVSDRYRQGASIQLHFHLKMQEKDKDLLHKVKDVLGCGGVYFQNELRPNHTHCYRYTVSAHRDIIEKLIPFFEKYPLQSASKMENFLIFRKIASIVAKKQHLKLSGIKKIQALKSVMNKRKSGLA